MDAASAAQGHKFNIPFGGTVELLNEGRRKVISLLKNDQHELTVDSVIYGGSPGNVYVDTLDNPKSFFIKTPECNMIGGSATNEVFNSEVKPNIDYFDSIICDTEGWTEAIKKIHPNCALRRFSRKYFRHVNQTEVYYPINETKIEFVYHDTLKTLHYGNKEIVQNWINILRIEYLHNIPLAAIVVRNNAIVSCSALDCIIGDSVEIGIKTIMPYRRNGYASFAVSSLVKKLYEAGIANIGWHCMSSNIGSIKTALRCGFVEGSDYEAFFPFPPIENATDLSINEWYRLGEYYADKGSTAIDQYWQAARCFAHSGDEKRVLSCVSKLVERKQFWFLNYINECSEFESMKTNQDWNRIIVEAKQKST